MSKKALIIVDMLNDFIDEKGVLFCGKEARDIIPFIRDRLETFRRQKDLVVFLKDTHEKEDREFDRFPPHCVAGTWGSEVISELAPKPDEIVISKTRFSGFFGTNLDEILEKRGIEEAEVVGVCTSICVMDTVGGLSDRDYKVVVPVKGVADFDQQLHEFSLKRMEQIYGAEVA